VEEVYLGACCAVLDGSLFVLVLLAHQDQLVWFDGEKGGRVKFFHGLLVLSHKILVTT
jgi:hypothetical protein